MVVLAAVDGADRVVGRRPRRRRAGLGDVELRGLSAQAPRGPGVPKRRRSTTMGKLPPGRALWEPSSDINNYGTTLALELLPYFTHGRIDSMEGLYFESSATTDFHFMTVSELTAPGAGVEPGARPRLRRHRRLRPGRRAPAHARRALLHGRVAEAKQHADANTGLKLVATRARPRPARRRSAGRSTRSRAGTSRRRCRTSRSSCRRTAGPSSKCFGTDAPPKGTHDPELAAWECSAAPWWNTGDLVPPVRGDRARELGARRRASPRPRRSRRGRCRRSTVGPVRRGRRLDLVPRVARRCAGRGEDVVLPELEGPRRAAARGGSRRTSWSSSRRATT